MNNNANSNKSNGITKTKINTNRDIATNTDSCSNRSRLLEIYVDVFASSIEFYSRLNSAFIDALSVPFTDARNEIKEIKTQVIGDGRNLIFRNYQEQQDFYKNAEKIILSKIRNKFDTNFREKTFLISLSEFMEAHSNLAKATGIGLLYQQIANVNAYWNNMFIEPIRDNMYRTPSHRIHSENKYSLFHYDLPLENLDESGKFEEKADKQRTSDLNSIPEEHSATSVSTPLLIIYAFINRNYILDLLPNFSIVRNFQKQGFDVYTTDWGTPSAFDKELTVGHYVNNYLGNAVDYILNHSNSEKVSLLGYCWGGDLALMYASLYPDKVKNIVTFATPGDFSLDNNLLSIWTKSINADTIVDTFGNTPGAFINSSFLLRSPIDVLHKYPHFFLEGGKPKDLESIMQFFATETWLYDSPPIIGEIYRQFVDDCYKKNLLIKNEMILDGNKKIDLSKIKQPFLNVIAKKDDLVDPASSKAINEVIGSADKSTIEFNSGHVGACISSRAHEELWPKVGDWLKSRQRTR
ncbi:alpha/beta fold hydrolase [Candidatus Nitrosocosmicus hydrocola]|uniref:alpha/beta fold hydrolase n=1 Tax=Candidatus Nitrosocosmicus hydrocola TaxID=1826872 RepID=UPI0011E59D42|nr:alpha/beta fold hydrolase [Candidatus Nitrosocosmicus hydrocola]